MEIWVSVMRMLEDKEKREGLERELDPFLYSIWGARMECYRLLFHQNLLP